jgi:aspartate aminotransferase
LLGRRTAAGTVIADDAAFADYLLDEAGVAVVDGTSFEFPGHIRLSLAASSDDLAEACRRIARAVAELN